MISKESIESLTNDFLKGTDLYMVDVKVNVGNLIIITIDSDTNLSIDHCIALSKSIEKSLDRDVEDFDLRVSSFGADKPFKLRRQYKKSIGRELEITLNDDSKLIGHLMQVNDDSILLELKGKKKKHDEDNKNKILKFDDIKEARIILSFK